jgi:Tfp pilus assembly protein PilF
MQHWKIAGIAATLIIILMPPVYFLRHADRPLVDRKIETAFIGAKRCATCHRPEYEKWRNSHHDLAMDVATDKTVLGNFNGAEFENLGVRSKFYRKDGKFFVHTQGPGGRMGEYEITHTFGVYPLQQYLIPFPGGRMQCLPIAWDVPKKQWYHLYPEQPIDPDDWLYWTNAGQNWNGMCAECHSTNLKKGFDIETDTYRTTWSEIDVSCEACHGPGSGHAAWAEIPEMGRPEIKNRALTVQTSDITSLAQVELCAPCHSRRSSLGDNTHTGGNFLNGYVPQLINQGMYFADGQILEEVYVYGSFLQSKMFDRDVRCSDCHDVHSIKTVKEGNGLCLQCHRADLYDTKTHHFHKKKGEPGDPLRSETGEILFDVGTGAQCVQCHMPGRVYMGVDYRPDHSFRIPRPDFSIRMGVPNACNRCHVKKSNQWSQDHLTRWYGTKYKPHWATIIDAGRKRIPEAQKELTMLGDDRLYPTIARATAMSLLGAYSDTLTVQAFERALNDESAMMRHAAVRNFPPMDPERLVQRMAPLLYDPIRSVRIEAARRLAEIPQRRLGQDLEKVYQRVLGEYRTTMEYSADFSASRLNLGNLYASLGQLDKAEENYRKAIQIDTLFYPAKVNLAMLYNRMGKNSPAEKLLRQVAEAHPELYEIQYSMGLLLAEEKKYEEAAQYLAVAAGGIPGRARIHYNLGLLLSQLKRNVQAEAALKKAVAIEPGNMDYLFGLADFYIKHGMLNRAKPVAEQMIRRHPSNKLGNQLLDLINKRLRTNG